MAGRALLAARDDLAGVLDEQYLRSRGDRDAIFGAYRADHRQG